MNETNKHPTPADKGTEKADKGTGKIHILSREVVDRIAAGEVIERLSSVGRELIENSIDAKSKNIDVIIQLHPEIFIIVRDDGVGMNREDLKIATQSHATSKISQFEEIFTCNTRGFRGEALASIAAVSKLSILSAVENNGKGLEVHYQLGVPKKILPTAHVRGTTVKVMTLFYNVPVRQRFISDLNRERHMFKKEVVSYSIANEGVGFRLFFRDRHGRDTLNFSVPPYFSFKERIIRSHLGSQGASGDLSVHLLPVKKDFPELTIEGFAGNFRAFSSQRQHQHLYLQNREIESALFYRAVSEAYRPFLPSRMHGYVYLKLAIKDPYMVDNNFHPAKRQVKFKKNSTIYQAIYYSLREVLSTHLSKGSDLASGFESRQPFDPLSGDTKNQDNIQGESSSPPADFSVGKTLFSDYKQDGESVNREEDSINREEKSILQSHFLGSEDNHEGRERENGADKNLQGINSPTQNPSSDNPHAYEYDTHQNGAIKVLGQIAKLYIVFSIENNLYIMDQHAAHERVNYDMLKTKFLKEGIEMESLLVPLQFEMYPQHVERLEDERIRLAIKKFGFAVEIIGKKEVIIEEVPAFLPEHRRLQVARELVEVLMRQDEQGLDKIEEQDFFREIIARMACRMSIMSGDQMSAMEMQSLVFEIVQKNYQTACPHGRPFVKKISLRELDSFFDRNRHIR